MASHGSNNEQVTTSACVSGKSDSQKIESSTQSVGNEADYSRNAPDNKPKQDGDWRRTPWKNTGDRNSHSRNPPDRVMFDKLSQISGPTYELKPLDYVEKKFSGRTRMYVGNIPPKTTEEEIKSLFEPFGETSEIFLNKEKNFAFVKMDYRYNAEKAKCSLNGYLMKGKYLKVRFAPNGSTIKVKNLDDFVTNELLHLSFSIFGEIDRCVVIVDDKGKPTGEGLVEYARKTSATLAFQKCSDACFFLTTSLRPVIVENYEVFDEYDGHSERNVTRKGHDYFNYRSVGPRYAPPDSFEYQSGMLWKQLYNLHQQKELALKKDFDINRKKLKAQIELTRYEHETAMLREQLRAREASMEKQKREWEIKKQEAEEARKRSDEHMKRQEEDIRTFMMARENEMRRIQQESNLYEQAYQLDNMLNVAEQNYDTYFNYNEVEQDSDYRRNENRDYDARNSYGKRRRVQTSYNSKNK